MKILIVIVIFIMLFLIINILYKRTNHYKNTINQLQKYLKGVPRNLEIINTGSTYARYAFDYDYTALKGFNFGLQPQSLSYDLKILKQYTCNLDKGCIVLITLPDLIFGFLDYKNDHRNTKYYYFLESKNIIGYSKFKYLTRVVFPILSNKKNIFRIIKDEPLNEAYNQDINLMNTAQIQNDAASKVKRWKEEFKLKNTIDNNLPNELEKMFESTTRLVDEIINYCLDYGFRPVLVVPPCSSIINDLFSKPFIKKVLYDNIKKANKRKVPVLDYLYDVRFQDYKLYMNSDMLNKAGREKFTRVVVKDLEGLEIIR